MENCGKIWKIALAPTRLGKSVRKTSDQKTGLQGKPP